MVEIFTYVLGPNCNFDILIKHEKISNFQKNMNAHILPGAYA